MEICHQVKHRLQAPHKVKKSHFILVTLWCGRTVTTNFSQMHAVKKIFLPMVLRSRA